MKRFYTILKTELKLSIRGMDMIIFAICMPLVVISLLGSIFGSRPAYPGARAIHFWNSPSGQFLP